MEVMNDKDFEEMLDSMADFTSQVLSEEEEQKEKVRLGETLVKVRDMLSSKSFQRKCKEQAKTYGVNEKYIKNMYAANLLNKLGMGATLVAELIGEAFNYLVRFVSYVLQKIMDIAVSIIKKIVNILTFRKEVA